MNTNFAGFNVSNSNGFTITSNQKYFIQMGALTPGTSGTVTFHKPYSYFVEVIITGTTSRADYTFDKELYPNYLDRTRFTYTNLFPAGGSSAQWLAIGY